MIKKKLESYVTDQFGMDLHQFLRQKVEGESLYDYEIAAILNVSATSIRKLRNFFGIGRADGFSRRFEMVYGAGAVEKFKNLIEDPGMSLADVGKHFDFTREYARQVYQKLYGSPYTETYKRKQALKRKDRLSSVNRASRLNGKCKEVRKKIESMGLLPDGEKKEGLSMTLNNGYKLAIRATSTPVPIGKKQYYRINNSKCTVRDFDFFICLCKSDNEDIHFIIPSEIMPRAILTLLPHAGPDQSKYAQFKEAWNLLQGKDQNGLLQSH
ncbi:MAG: hypothetical protein AMK69_28380 [Nitrospira bacterium SG8_3]|nr:MAG: hypothetical protein AMK69_28380 [Nitrospira bacterium SG8_3]